MSVSARRPKINASENQKFMWERKIRNSSPHQLPSPARTAAYVLATHMNPDGVCFIGAARLAKGMGVSERTAKRAKRQLIDLGWVQILNDGERKSDGSFATSVYRALGADPSSQSEDTLAQSEEPRGGRICHQVVTPVTPGSDTARRGGSGTGAPGSDTGGPRTGPLQISAEAVSNRNRLGTDSLRGEASLAYSIPSSNNLDWKDECVKEHIQWRRGIKAARIAGKAHEDDTAVSSPTSTVSSQDRKMNGATASQDRKMYGSSRLERRAKVGLPLSPAAKAADEESRQTRRAAWAEVMAQL